MHLRALALSAIGAVLGPGCSDTHIGPNGKHRVLMFDQGIGYDGTTLEADLDPGLRLVEAPLEDHGYRMRVACDTPPAGNVGEVRVRIIANGAIRYSDALDMECRRADGLVIDVRPESLDLAQASPPRALVAAGAKIFVAASPWAIGSDGGQESLFGLGFTVDDADGAFALEGAPLWGASLTLDALAPDGSGSVVHAGTIHGQLPVQALPDQAWTWAWRRERAASTRRLAMRTRWRQCRSAPPDAPPRATTSGCRARAATSPSPAATGRCSAGRATTASIVYRRARRRTALRQLGRQDRLRDRGRRRRLSPAMISRLRAVAG